MIALSYCMASKNVTIEDDLFVTVLRVASRNHQGNFSKALNVLLRKGIDAFLEEGRRSIEDAAKLQRELRGQ